MSEKKIEFANGSTITLVDDGEGEYTGAFEMLVAERDRYKKVLEEIVTLETMSVMDARHIAEQALKGEDL